MADFLRKPWIVDYLAEGTVRRAKNVQILELSQVSEAIVVAKAADSTHQIRLLFTKETLNLLRSEHDVTFRGAFFTLDDIEPQCNLDFTEMFIFVRKLTFIGGDSNHPVQKTVKDASADPKVQTRLQALRAEQEGGSTEGNRVDSQELVDAIRALSDDIPNLPYENQNANQEWMPWPGFCYLDCVIPPDQQAVLDALPGWDDSFDPQQPQAPSPTSPHSDIIPSGFVLSGEEPAHDQHQEKAMHPRELGDFHREQAPPTAAGTEAGVGGGHDNQEENYLPSQDNSFLSQCYSQTHRSWNDVNAAANKAHAPATNPPPSLLPPSYTARSVPASYVTAISKSLHPPTLAPETQPPSAPTPISTPHTNALKETDTAVQSPKPANQQPTNPTSPVRSPQKHASPHLPTSNHRLSPNQPPSPSRNRTPERPKTPVSAQRQPTTPHRQTPPQNPIPPHTAPPPILSPLRQAAGYLLSPIRNVPTSAPASVSRERSRERKHTPQPGSDGDALKEKDSGSVTQERSLASRLASKVFGWVMGGSESNTETNNSRRESPVVSDSEREDRPMRSPQDRKRAHSIDAETQTPRQDAKRQHISNSPLVNTSQIHSQRPPPPIHVESSHERVEISVRAGPVLSQLSQHIHHNTQNENSWQDSYQFPIPQPQPPPPPPPQPSSQPQSQDHGSATTTQSEEHIPSATQSVADHHSGQSPIRASFEYISPAQHPLPDSQPPPPVLFPTPPKGKEESHEPHARSSQQQPITDENQSQSAAVSQNSNSFVTPAQRSIPTPARGPPVSAAGSDGAAVTHVSESPLESSAENSGSRERTWAGLIPVPGLGLVTPHVRGEGIQKRGQGDSQDVSGRGLGERAQKTPHGVSREGEGEGENGNRAEGNVVVTVQQNREGTDEDLSNVRGTSPVAERAAPVPDNPNLTHVYDYLMRVRDAKRKEYNRPNHRFMRPRA